MNYVGVKNVLKNQNGRLVSHNALNLSDIPLKNAPM